MSNTKSTCAICGSSFRTQDRKRHEKSRKHLACLGENCEEEEPITSNDPNILLQELENPDPIYLEIEEEEPKKDEVLTVAKKDNTEEDKEAYLDKINKLMVLFPKECQREKVPSSNSSLEVIKQKYNRMMSSVSGQSFSNFVGDAITNSIQAIEPISSMTKYNISGLSILLKSNPEFIRLCKIMSVKYGSFVKTPPEIQLLFLIATMTYITVQKNNQSSKLKEMLNEPYQPPQTQLKDKEKLPDVLIMKL